MRQCDASVVGIDQNWLKKELNIMNIIMVLILFYGNVFHYYITVIIIKQTYGSSIVDVKIPCPTTSRGTREICH